MHGARAVMWLRSCEQYRRKMLLGVSLVPADLRGRVGYAGVSTRVSRDRASVLKLSTEF